MTDTLPENIQIPPPIPENKLRIKNAVISEVVIGLTDNNQLTAWVVANFGLHKQGFGGLNLGVGANAYIFITNVLNIVGVKELGALNGKAIRVEHDNNKIYGLGNFMDEKWYNIDKGIIEEVPPSLSDAQGNVVIVDENGKKHHTLAAEAGVLGYDGKEMG